MSIRLQVTVWTHVSISLEYTATCGSGIAGEQLCFPHVSSAVGERSKREKNILKVVDNAKGPLKEVVLTCFY